MHNERTWPQQCWKSCALLRYASVITEQKKCWELLAETFDRFQSLRNNTRQHPTICNRVCKRTQHVTSNNVGSCWPTMLRPFIRGLTPKSLQKNSFESARDIQEHSKILSKTYIYIISNIYYIKIYIHIKK